MRTAQGYTVQKAVADWLDEGLPGRTAKTVEANRDSLRTLKLPEIAVEALRGQRERQARERAELERECRQARVDSPVRELFTTS